MRILGLLPGGLADASELSLSHVPSLPTTSYHPLWHTTPPPDHFLVAPQSGNGRQVLSSFSMDGGELQQTGGEPEGGGLQEPGLQDCAAKTAKLQEDVNALSAQVDTMKTQSGLADSDAEATLEGPGGEQSQGANSEMTKKLEAKSAKFINLPQSSKKIKDVIAELKGALKGPGGLGGSAMSKAIRPGMVSLIQEAGPEGLGATVKDFSAALADLSESVNVNLKKERIAMMTTQDIPELLQDTVVEMNIVNKEATFLRQKLAAISELANLELARAGVVGRARAKTGAVPGGVVAQGDEAMEAEMENPQQVPRLNEPPKPETVEDAETVRLVYEALDKTVRGEKTPMAPAIRQEIAQAVIGVLKQPKTPQVASAVDPQLARTYLDSASAQDQRTDTELARTDPLASMQKQQNAVMPGAAPQELGDSRAGGSAEMVQKILDQMRANQDMDAKGEPAQMLGFGDPVLAPGIAATMASILGVAKAASQSAAPGTAMAAAVSTVPGHTSSTRPQTFLSSAGAQPAVARAKQRWSGQRRSAAMNFF